MSDWSSDVCSSDLVVMSPPGFDQDAGLGERVEDLAIEQFIAQRPVEALAVSILPWRSGGDVERLHADLRPPFLHRRRRSEERRDGKGCVSTCRYRWSTHH